MSRLNFADLKNVIKRDFTDMCVTYLGPVGPQTPKLPARSTADGKIKKFNIGEEFKIYKDDNEGKDNVIVFMIGRNEYEMKESDFGQGVGLNHPIFSIPNSTDVHCLRGGKKKRSKKRSLKKKQKKSARKSKRFYFF